MYKRQADDGTITTAAVFPNRMVEYPSGSGEMMPMQAVPTRMTSLRARVMAV